MCTFNIRVHTCGHYEKALYTPCNDAIKTEQPCSPGTEYNSTTAVWCALNGCDGEAGGKREGPGKKDGYYYYIRDVCIKLIILNFTGSRYDGGFASWEVDWSDY